MQWIIDLIKSWVGLFHSADVPLTHDGSDAFMKWVRGHLTFQIDDGVNNNTWLFVVGKGTGYGGFRFFDQDNNEYLTAYCYSGQGIMRIDGSSPAAFLIQNEATCPVKFFNDAGEGETEAVEIVGRRTGDSKRTFSTQIDPGINDRVRFSGVSDFSFIGSLFTQGYVDSVGGFKDHGVAGIDCVFDDNAGKQVTVSGGIITALET